MRKIPMGRKLVVELSVADKMSKSLAKIEGKFKKFTKSISNTFKKLTSMRNIIGVALIIRLGKSFLDASSNVEVFGKQLEMVTGSAQKASVALDAIREFARTSPLETEDVVQSYVRLRAVGIDPTIQQMRKLGGVAVLMDRQMTEVLDAFIGLNKRTLRNLGIEIDRTGDKAIIQSGTIKKIVEKDSASIRKALIELWEERFPNALETAADTTKSKTAIMKSEVWELAVAIGQKLKPAWDKIVEVVGIAASESKKLIDPDLEKEILNEEKAIKKLEYKLDHITGKTSKFNFIREEAIKKEKDLNRQLWIRKSRLEVLLGLQKKSTEGDILGGTGKLGPEKEDIEKITEKIKFPKIEEPEMPDWAKESPYAMNWMVWEEQYQKTQLKWKEIDIERTQMEIDNIEERMRKRMKR